jgi:hypothetical protein
MPIYGLGIVIDVVGRMQDVPNDVLAMARMVMLYTAFEQWLCIAGSMAFPYSPSDIPVGPVYRFSIRHLVVIDGPCAIVDYRGAT